MITPNDQMTDLIIPAPAANYTMYPCIEVTVQDCVDIVPAYAITPPWNGQYGGFGCNNMAIRETYTGPAAIGTAGILGSKAYNALADGRQLKQISNQAIGGGFMMNSAYVYIDYGAGYPVPPYNVTTHIIATNGGLQWFDVMTPTNVTFGGYMIPGCTDVIPTVTTTLMWLSTTGFNPTPLPVPGAMVTEVAYCPTCDIPGAIMCISQTDNYHFANAGGLSPETQFAVAANPCPCPAVPEVATIILISVGLIGLAGFVVLKRKHAATIA
jgi:hypothetical protein